MDNVEMEKYLFLCILLCCALLEVQCLKCYVCENCAKVKEEELKTCGAETTPESSTTTTATTFITIPPITTSTTLEILTDLTITSDTTTSEPEVSFATVVTEPTTVTSTTTKRRITPTTNKVKLTSLVAKEPSTPFTITTMESTTPETATRQTVKEPSISTVPIPIPTISSTEFTIFTTEPQIDSTLNETEFPRNFTTSSSESSTITETVTTGPTVLSTSIYLESIENFNISDLTTTEPTVSSFTLSNSEATTNTSRAPTEPTIYSSQSQRDLTNTTLFTTESIVTSALITPEPGTNFTLPVAGSILITGTSTTTSTLNIAEPVTNPIIPEASTTIISTLNIAEPITDSTLRITREPSAAYITTDSENTFITPNTRPITTTFTETRASTLREPVAPFKTEPTMPLVVMTTTDSAEIVGEADDLPSRSVRSMPEGCACNNNQICDCPMVYQRFKRYALRGRTLANEEVKYICVVDRFLENGTEIVKRGCATLEEDQQTSCLKSGFRVNCKTCIKDQCNGSSLIQSSVVFMFTFCFVPKLFI